MCSFCLLTYAASLSDYTFAQPFPCTSCGRSYRHKSSLISHQKDECGKLPSYTCHLCAKAFKKKHHLKKHLGSIHKVQ